MDVKHRVPLLWGLIMAGLIFHTILEFLPLFFGASIAIPDAPGTMPDGAAWYSVVFYMVPMVCVLLAAYTEAKWFKVFNLLFATLFAISSLLHVLEEVGVNHIQTLLLGFVLTVNLLLVLSSWQWFSGPKAD